MSIMTSLMSLVFGVLCGFIFAAHLQQNDPHGQLAMRLPTNFVVQEFDSSRFKNFREIKTDDGRSAAVAGPWGDDDKISYGFWSRSYPFVSCLPLPGTDSQKFQVRNNRRDLIVGVVEIKTDGSHVVTLSDKQNALIAEGVADETGALTLRAPDGLSMATIKPNGDARHWHVEVHRYSAIPNYVYALIADYQLRAAVARAR